MTTFAPTRQPRALDRILGFFFGETASKSTLGRIPDHVSFGVTRYTYHNTHNVDLPSASFAPIFLKLSTGSVRYL